MKRAITAFLLIVTVLLVIGLDEATAVTDVITLSEYTLSTSSTANGSVSKSPDQAVYHYGDEVVLTASASPGWIFSYWEGDVSDPSSLSIIAVMDRDKTVAAVFERSYFTFDSHAQTITGYDATGGRDVVIPAMINGVTVKHIGANAFRLNNLTSVTIPDSVTTIDNYAFADNPNLTSVIIGNNVTTIGVGAFRDNNLTSVTIPNTVTAIGVDAFLNNALTSVVIPDSVITVGAGAFLDNALTSVSIGNNVETIGTHAFRSNLLTVVTIPDSVETIGAHAFRSNLLTVVTIPDSVETIGVQAFAHNALTSVAIPGSVKSISTRAFAFNALTSVTIGNGVTTIGSAAFENNALTSVTIPDSVTNIGVDAFRNNTLISVTLSNGLSTTGIGAFRDNSLTSVAFPNSFTTIYSQSFANNALTSVIIPDSITSIDREAFMNNALTSVTIPDSVTAIARDAFKNNAITSVTIPDCATVFPGAFANNPLTTIIIGNNVDLGADAMGTYHDEFRRAYNVEKRAGTYVWAGTEWIKQQSSTSLWPLPSTGSEHSSAYYSAAQDNFQAYRDVYYGMSKEEVENAIKQNIDVSRGGPEGSLITTIGDCEFLVLFEYNNNGLVLVRYRSRSGFSSFRAQGGADDVVESIRRLMTQSYGYPTTDNTRRFYIFNDPLCLWLTPHKSVLLRIVKEEDQVFVELVIALHGSGTVDQESIFISQLADDLGFNHRGLKDERAYRDICFGMSQREVEEIIDGTLGILEGPHPLRRDLNRLYLAPIGREWVYMDLHYSDDQLYAIAFYTLYYCETKVHDIVGFFLDLMTYQYGKPYIILGQSAGSTSGVPTYAWNVKSRLVVLEATPGEDQFSGEVKFTVALSIVDFEFR